MPNPEQHSVGHPNLSQHRISDLRRALDLFGAAAAWVLQMSLSAIITSRVCYPHHTLMQGAPFPLVPTLFALHLACVALGAWSSFIAWQSWRDSRQTNMQGAKHTMQTGEGRSRFLTMMGFTLSIIFMSAILFTACSLLLVTPCKGL